MVFKAEPCRSRWEGLAVTSWVVMIDLLLLTWMVRRPVDWIKFILLFAILLSLPLLAHLVYRTWSAFSLEYWIDRDAVTIYWAGMRQVIPLTAIVQIIQGQVQDVGKAGWQHWPAPQVRPGRTLGMMNLTLFSTRPLTDCLLLDTGSAVFAISPQQQDEFLDMLQERYQLGPARDLTVAHVRPFWWRRIAQIDLPSAVLILGGIIGVLALFGLVMTRFPDLPGNLAFSYYNDGSPNVVREKSALFLLPTIGLLAWIVNGLWGAWMAARDQQTGAYMLWGGAIVVEIVTFLALFQLLP